MKKTKTLLDRIIEHKREEILQSKKSQSIEKIKELLINSYSETRNFSSALKKEDIAIIAEIKKVSPFCGPLCSDFDVINRAKNYEISGADAISVVTEKHFFQGDIGNLQKVKEHTSLPLLRKDFIIDPYQLYTSKLFGADAVLLLCSVLEDIEIKDYMKLAASMGMACLLEVRTQHELIRALRLGGAIIGINNRDMSTGKIDAGRFRTLAEQVPEDKILVCESGIQSSIDVAHARLAGADAILVGTSLMCATDIQEKMQELKMR